MAYPTSGYRSGQRGGGSQSPARGFSTGGFPYGEVGLPGSGRPPPSTRSGTGTKPRGAPGSSGTGLKPPKAPPAPRPADALKPVGRFLLGRTPLGRAFQFGWDIGEAVHEWYRSAEGQEGGQGWEIPEGSGWYVKYTCPDPAGGANGWQDSDPGFCGTGQSVGLWPLDANVPWYIKRLHYMHARFPANPMWGGAVSHGCDSVVTFWRDDYGTVDEPGPQPVELPAEPDTWTPLPVPSRTPVYPTYPGLDPFTDPETRPGIPSAPNPNRPQVPFKVQPHRRNPPGTTPWENPQKGDDVPTDPAFPGRPNPGRPDPGWPSRPGDPLSPGDKVLPPLTDTKGESGTTVVIPPNGDPPYAGQPHSRRPPRRREKEKKFMAMPPIARLISKAFQEITEIGDAIEALYDALPNNLKIKYRPGDPIHIGEKAEVLMKNLDKLDGNEAIKNLVMNAIEDGVIGAGHARAAGIRPTGRPQGIGFGPAL